MEQPDIANDCRRTFEESCKIQDFHTVIVFKDIQIWRHYFLTAPCNTYLCKSLSNEMQKYSERDD